MPQNFKGSENFIHKTSLKKFNEFTHCLCDSYNGTASCLLQEVIPGMYLLKSIEVSSCMHGHNLHELHSSNPACLSFGKY